MLKNSFIVAENCEQFRIVEIEKKSSKTKSKNKTVKIEQQKTSQAHKNTH